MVVGVDEDKWGAIGNARWGGALLSEVLKEAGFSMEECQKARHVIFEGLDVEPDNSLFGGSITIEKATDPRGDVLLAYEMNGEPLPRCCTSVTQQSTQNYRFSYQGPRVPSACSCSRGGWCSECEMAFKGGGVRGGEREPPPESRLQGIQPKCGLGIC